MNCLLNFVNVLARVNKGTLGDRPTADLNVRLMQSVPLIWPVFVRSVEILVSMPAESMLSVELSTTEPAADVTHLPNPTISFT